MPDGPRETTDTRIDRKSCLPGVVPGAATTIDESSASPAWATRHLRVRERLLLRSGDTRVLHVHLQLVDGVLVVMRHRRQRHRRHQYRHLYRYDNYRHGHRRPRHLCDHCRL